MEVVSADTTPSCKVHPKAIQVMKEIGIDLSKNRPKSVIEFLNESFDYIITVCYGANESCPVFSGNVKNRLHIGFADPSYAEGTAEFLMNGFRRVRDEIKEVFLKFYNEKITKVK